LDTTTKEFLVIAKEPSSLWGQPKDDAQPQQPPPPPKTSSSYRISTSLWQQQQHNDGGVALGGINPRWTTEEQNKVRWFPKIVFPHQLSTSSIYMLPDHVVLLPFHSFAAHNVGHLVWDDFYAMYQLLSSFGFVSLNDNHNHDTKKQILLLRVDTIQPPLYGTCDKQWKHRKQCTRNFMKWLPLMGIDPQTFSTLQRIQFVPTTMTTSTSSTIVCARTAVAGLGMLTDHGINDHGWNPLAIEETRNQHIFVQNTGKSALFYQFRNFMLRNLHLPTELVATATGSSPSSTTSTNAWRIVLSTHSSSYTSRKLDFQLQYDAMVAAFPSTSTTTIQRVILSQMSVMEQVQLISQSNVLVSVCGGGTVTATFLPRGATLILYYDEYNGYDFHHPQPQGIGPAFLDWDLFNNAGHLRVHWLPLGSINTPQGIALLISLIQHEMEEWF
jgi:hypothetical protein